MCGIAGIIANNSDSYRREVIAMTDIIKHRGPDGFGFYYDKNFALGHRRLSVLDLTNHGAQPMKYMGKYVITYNGEVYNYLELRNELKCHGYSFFTETDTEVIMAAYDHWGKNCLGRLNGMWSFALFDRDKNILFCSRDRYGVKPFYYTQIAGKFAFASEIKQFSVLNGWKADINKSRLFDYLTMDGLHDHTEQTMFAQVYQLQGGEYLEYNLADMSYFISRWYHLPEPSAQDDMNFKTACAEFKNIFEDSIKLRLRSDVKVGSCLSGGLDSASIVCTMNHVLKESGDQKNQEIVSACFPNSVVDEQNYIDAVITKTGVKAHKVYPAFNDLFPNLDAIIWHQDEPFGSTSIYSQWCVYKEAKNNDMIVMLDGQGADEYLAGYSDYHQMHFHELLLNGNIFRLKKSLNNYKSKYREYYFSPYRYLLLTLIRKVFPDIILKASLDSMKRKRDMNRTHYLKLHSFNVDGNQFIAPAVETIRELSINQLLFTSLPKLLHHQDRDSMAHSVESRVPFLDYRLVEFVVNLPSLFKVNNAVTKYILRASMKGIIPDSIVNRYDKLGFATPQDAWVDNNPAIFRKEIEESCERLHKYVNHEHVMNLFDASVSSGGRIDSRMFWRLICVNRWANIFKVLL